MKTTFACILLLACMPLHCLAQQGDPEPLVIEDIQCRGNATTSCGFILGYLYLAAGDRVDEEEIQNARLRLTTLPDFRKVDIYLERGSVRGNARLIVEVVEADPVFAQFALGAAWRLTSISQLGAARVGHQNVFGKGKLVDLTLVRRVPIDGPRQRAFEAAVRYADPHLFDSKKYFFQAVLGHVDGFNEDRYGSYIDIESTGVGVSLGRRFWDFSYLTIGYGYRLSIDFLSQRWQNDGTYETKDAPNLHGIDLVYGWNSEDDYYLPTRGSAFHIGFGWEFGANAEDNSPHLQFRKTWSVGEHNLLTLKIGGDPTTERRQSFNEGQFLAVQFARSIAGGSDLKRGRWYLEPGLDGVGFDTRGRAIYEIGLKAGIRLDTESFGLIDLYLFGSAEAGGYR